MVRMAVPGAWESRASSPGNSCSPPGLVTGLREDIQPQMDGMHADEEDWDQDGWDRWDEEKAVDLHFRIWTPILFIPSIPVQIRLCG